jgi:hypothetical protein
MQRHEMSLSEDQMSPDMSFSPSVANYQATVKGIIEKTDAGYTKVQTDLVVMRKSGELPYGWLTDNTRVQRKPRSFDGVEEALEATAQFYRKNLWASADCYVEVWLEKDALSGVIFPITAKYDVPLMVARGYASLSFLHTAAEYISDLDVPTYMYHLGDYDPSGVNAGEKIEETLREMAPDSDIEFERIAVEPSQIEEWNLPTRPTKASDTRARNFGEVSVELDAIDPDTLRGIVLEAIERHLPEQQLAVLKMADAAKRGACYRWPSVGPQRRPASPPLRGRVMTVVQLALFEVVEQPTTSRYPGAPGYKAPGASAEAAQRIAGTASRLRGQVLEELRQWPAGRNADELAVGLRRSPLSVRPRLSELHAAGKIVATGERRRNESGMSASVWRARR